MSARTIQTLALCSESPSQQLAGNGGQLVGSMGGLGIGLDAEQKVHGAELGGAARGVGGVWDGLEHPNQSDTSIAATAVVVGEDVCEVCRKTFKSRRRVARGATPNRDRARELLRLRLHYLVARMKLAQLAVAVAVRGERRGQTSPRFAHEKPDSNRASGADEREQDARHSSPVTRRSAF